MANIARMADKARYHNLKFRPHFKTHQSIEVGEWFRDIGVSAITVSSVSMAEFFSNAGWTDITVAFPLNPRETDRINGIDSSVNLNMTVENTEAIDLSGSKLSRHLDIFIKIDTGYHRTGIWFSEDNRIRPLISAIQKNPLLTFRGFLIHAGHSYSATSRSEVIAIHDQSIKCIERLNQEYRKEYPELIVSYGDTPSSSLADNFSGIDEIRPGNFVFYDLMQVQIGSCSMDDIAVLVACPVVAKHPNRNQVILHGGAVHFSKEFLIERGRKIYGKRVMMAENTWAYNEKYGILAGLSQEHGILDVQDPVQFDKIKIGDLVFILPIHSCLTANLINHCII